MKFDLKASHSASAVLQRYLKQGLIVKPEACEVCSLRDVYDGHHLDYDSPLEVIWVCRLCHKAIEGKETDQALPSIKLPDDYEYWSIQTRTPVPRLYTDDDISEFKHFLQKLKPIEKRVISLRFESGMTLSVIASVVKKTKQRVSQIQDSALNEIRRLISLPDKLSNLHKAMAKRALLKSVIRKLCKVYVDYGAHDFSSECTPALGAGERGPA